MSSKGLLGMKAVYSRPSDGADEIMSPNGVGENKHGAYFSALGAAIDSRLPARSVRGSLSQNASHCELLQNIP